MGDGWPAVTGDGWPAVTGDGWPAVTGDGLQWWGVVLPKKKKLHTLADAECLAQRGIDVGATVHLLLADALPGGAQVRIPVACGSGIMPHTSWGG